MAQHLTSSEVMLQGLMTEDEEYLKGHFYIEHVRNRGRSVFAKTTFRKGEYVMEYKGVCKKYDEGDYISSHRLYESNEESSYCLEFMFKGEKYFIDATREYQFGYARLINHALNPNLKLFKPLCVHSGEMPRIAMYAASNITIGDELFWDYFSSNNPVKCLLDKTERVTYDMRWMFSRRTKSGDLTYSLKKSSSSNRGGMCCLCHKYRKKLSNHLIQKHHIASKEKRINLLTEGRKSTHY